MIVQAATSKSLFRRVTNRLLHSLARTCPGATTLRPMLHRARRVLIGKEVFIGDDVFLDNEFPEQISIHDRAQISIRTIIIAHTRGPGRVIIEQDAFIGPNCVLVCGGGKTLRIGQGAVIAAGSVITKSVPPHLFVAPPPVKATARVGVPLPLAHTMEDFWAGLTPLTSPPPVKKSDPPAE
jgi:hypothetical protein